MRYWWRLTWCPDTDLTHSVEERADVVVLRALEAPLPCLPEAAERL